MKRTILLLVAFLLLFSPCFAAEDSGIKFSDLHGEVTVRPDDNEEGWELAELSSKLNVLDHVKTEQDSGAILSMQDMTTFVVKPESEIILTVPSGQDSKVTLVAGNIWVNVKKMVTNGTMEVEMSQAVAGIKGTNITCQTSRDEDRIQVLRGIAEVLIRETQERMTVAEGEELVVKAGGKTEKVEIDVAAEQERWKDQTSRMGESIQMNEVPEVLKGIMDSEASEFSRINETFTKLIAMTSIEEAEAMEIKKDAERFVGVILEDNLILNSIRKRIDTAMQSPDLPAADRVRLTSMLKEVAAVMAKQQSFQSQVVKIMRYEFKLSSLTEDIAPEIESLRTELAQAINDVDSVKSVLSANPAGQSQDWFTESSQICAEALNELDQLLQRANETLAANPTSAELQAIIKSINDQRSSISNMIKSLAVVEIPLATIVEISQLDDIISDNMVVLQNEIAAYNAITESGSIRPSQTVMERRLKATAKIMDSFARVKKGYSKAQRLYDNSIRAAASSKYKTSEQEELENTWRNISDRFQQLGTVSQELLANMADLERQLSEILR